MDSNTLCINTGLNFNEIPITEKLPLIKAAGFDAVFSDWKRDVDFEPIANLAKKLGLEYQSLHAPFYGMDDLWVDESGGLSDKMMRDIFGCTDTCAEFGIDLMICHTIIGMDNCTPTELGLQRIGELIEYADKKGITIAFENTEGLMYLEAVLDRFGNCGNVGFCFDSGHEMCYNAGHDVLKEFGKHLISTHLNDNLGQTDPNEITFYDDAHLLPFDGIADWERIAKEMKQLGYNNPLTFELNINGRPNRTVNDIYKKMSVEEYLHEAYKRAVKFREMLRNA